MIPIPPFLIRWAAVGLAAAAFGAFCYLKGVEHESKAWEAAQAAAQAEKQREIDRLTTNAHDVAQELSDERAQRERDARAFKEKLAHARNLATCTPALRPGAGDPVVRLTGDFVGLYNEGLHQGLPAPRDPARADGAAGGSDTAVSPEDVLDNVADNGAVCNKLRAQVTGWQELARRNGWAK